MAQFTFHVDPNEFIDSLDYLDRAAILERLRDEFEDGPRLDGAKTPTETDLQEILLDIWEKRIRLTPEQVSILKGVANSSSLA